MQPNRTMKPITQQTDDELLQSLHEAVAALPDAPIALQRAALALWPQPLLAPAPEWFKRIVALLSFDSWAGPALVTGMRSGSASSTRHLLYSAEGRDVDLRVKCAGDAYSVSGQILGPDESGTVHLVRVASSADLPADERSTPLDALGGFAFAAVPPGHHVMTLRLAGVEIALPVIDVGESPP